MANAASEVGAKVMQGRWKGLLPLVVGGFILMVLYFVLQPVAARAAAKVTSGLAKAEAKVTGAVASASTDPAMEGL